MRPAKTTTFENRRKTRMRFFRHTESIWSDVGLNFFTLGWGRAASRWSAPSPGTRTPREEGVLPHRPQMSSGRLFLDRAGRHQSPSPLHRPAQINMRSSRYREKDDISTLHRRRHFYFALTKLALPLDACMQN